MCLVLTSDARRVISELKSERPLAVFSFSNVDGAGTEIHLSVEHTFKHWETPELHGWCAQTKFKADCMKKVFNYMKHHTTAEAWDLAWTNAPTLSKQWSKLRATVEFLNVRSLMRFAGAPDVLQVIAFLPASWCVQVVQASDVGGVLNRNRTTPFDL